MDNIVRQVLTERSYYADSFDTYFKGSIYDDPEVSINIFLKVVNYMNSIYKKYPLAQFQDFSQDIKACETDDTQKLIIDSHYRIINHSCWTAMASKLYYSLGNMENYSLFENPFQLAFISPNPIIQFAMLVFTFFALMIQFV